MFWKGSYVFEFNGGASLTGSFTITPDSELEGRSLAWDFAWRWVVLLQRRSRVSVLSWDCVRMHMN